MSQYTKEGSFEPRLGTPPGVAHSKRQQDALPYGRLSFLTDRFNLPEADWPEMTVAVGTIITDRPPEQTRTSASTRTALTRDEWRRSEHRGRGAVRGVEESIGLRLEQNVPNASGRVDYGSALMSASKPDGSLSPARLIAIDPHGRQERSEAFLSNGMDQQEADDKHHRAGYAVN